MEERQLFMCATELDKRKPVLLKKRWLVFTAFILFVVFIIVSMQMRKISATHAYLITKYYRFESLKNEVVQQFTPSYGRLEAIELFIANIYPETDGYITVTIINDSGKTIFYKRYKAANIPTGEFYEYRINRKVNKGAQYRLYITYDGVVEDKPQIMISERKKNLTETEAMFVNEKISDYNLAITYHYSGRIS